jgi:hypothetical protein
VGLYPCDSKPAAAPYDTWGLGDAASAAPVVSNTTGGSMSAELQEEYDPARPNDYEQYQQLQREETKRAEEEAARRRQEEALAQMPLPGPPPLPPSQQTEPQGGLPPPPPLPGGGAGGGGQKCAPAEGQATTTRERWFLQIVVVWLVCVGFERTGCSDGSLPKRTKAMIPLGIANHASSWLIFHTMNTYTAPSAW